MRWLWYPTHLGRAILHQVRQADCPEHSRVISWSGARWRASRGNGRFEWASAAQSPPSGNSLDDQRDSAADGNRLDDDLRQDVFSIYAWLGRPGRVASWGQMGLGHSFYGRPLFPGHFSGALRRAAPGSCLGPFRTRAMGAVPRASPGIPGAAAFSVWHRAGDLHAVGAAARDFRQGVRTAHPAGRASQRRVGFFLSLFAEAALRMPAP